MTRIGLLTPSSNTVLEPISWALARVIPDLSLHIARFKVTEIALAEVALRQFDPQPMLAPAELLGHAKVDVITWNGTSASWLGLDADRNLRRAIEERTGIRTTTAVLSLFDLFREQNIRTIGLVTPYTADVQIRIADVYMQEQIEVIAESHLGIRDNFQFGLIDAATLDQQVAEVARHRPDAIVILCTNIAGAPHVSRWEATYDVSVLDSVAVTLHGALRATGIGTRLENVGRLLAV
jgi:maleate isomerase